MAVLTQNGWTDSSGNVLGIWTQKSDVVLAESIGVADGVRVRTLGGDDDIENQNQFGFGSFSNYGTIDTGNGDDKIKGLSRGSGLFNPGTIDTGNGSDEVSGIGQFSGIVNSGTIDTGNGNDKITGMGFRDTGVNNSSLGVIKMGNGDDILTGSGNIGISNDGIIRTGNGNDTIAAQTPNGGIGIFAGSGSVYFGNGNNILSGFGTGNFYGGKGNDKLELPSGSYTVGSATIDGNKFVTFTSGGSIMDLTEFDVLKIGNNTYDFSNLPSTVSG